MTEEPLTELLDRHFAGTASAADHGELQDLLAADATARGAFVARARLERGLEEAFAQGARREVQLDRLLNPRRKRSTRRWIAAASAAALVLAAWAVAMMQMNARTADREASVNGTPESEGIAPWQWQSVLPERPIRSAIGDQGAPPGWINRLEKYILPELDVRGQTVSQAIATVAGQVETLGFHGDAPEFRVHYPLREGETERIVHLHRKQLPLMQTLLYLAAVGGRTEVQIGREIEIAGFDESAADEERTLRVPPHFLFPEGAPDYIERLASADESAEDEKDNPFEPERERVDVSPVGLRTRLMEWGVDFGKVSSASHDQNTSTVTLTATPDQHGVLRTAAELASTHIRQIEVQLMFWELPAETFGKWVSGDYQPGVVELKVMNEPQNLVFVDSLRQQRGSPIKYPRVVTRSGAKALIESVNEVFDGAGEPSWTGVRFHCLPELQGEHIALEFSYERRVHMNSNETSDGELPVFSSARVNLELTLGNNTTAVLFDPPGGAGDPGRILLIELSPIRLAGDAVREPIEK